LPILHFESTLQVYYHLLVSHRNYSTAVTYEFLINICNSVFAIYRTEGVY